MTPTPRLRASYHEAGHAVAALAAGFDVIDCRVDDDGRGLMRYETTGDRTWRERYGMLSVIVAGAVAERRVFGYALLAAVDERRAAELLVTFPGERGELHAEAEVRAEGALGAGRDLLRTIAERVHVSGAWVPRVTIASSSSQRTFAPFTVCGVGRSARRGELMDPRRVIAWRPV